MRLVDLIAHTEVTDCDDGSVEITGIACDSRQVKAGDLFVAVPGVTVDGARFVANALRAGAVAVITPWRLDAVEAPQVLVPDARVALAQLAEAYYGFPSQRLDLVGITGTNGKTTTAYLIQYILKSAGHLTGMMGTICYDDGNTRAAAPMTTPDALQFSELLARMVDNDCEAAVTEVSSHALAQGRVAGAHFRVGVFTNLTRDHLDYHGDMESYGTAKGRLFRELDDEGVAILNGDDAWARRLAEGCPAECRFYGLEEGHVDLQGKIMSMALTGATLELRSGSECITVEVPLVGQHNVQNLMAALLTANNLGVSLEDALEVMKDFTGVPGRLERIDHDGGVHVFVDYAHTDDALRRVLGVLRPLTQGRLIVVFGCGGDRDRGKRPLMAQAAEELADIVIVTADNPRSEDEGQILDDIRKGFFHAENVVTVPDRAEAVAKAVATAQDGDTVLIAGKGHEDYQVLATGRIHLDDRELARDAIAGLDR